MWKVNKLVKQGSLKEFILKNGKRSQAMGKRKKPRDERSVADEYQLEKEVADATMSMIHEGFTSGSEKWLPDETFEGSQSGIGCYH